MIFVVCELMPGSGLSRRPSEERQLFTTVIAVAAGCGLGGMLTRKRRGPRPSVQDRASVQRRIGRCDCAVAGTPPLIARTAAPTLSMGACIAARRRAPVVERAVMAYMERQKMDQDDQGFKVTAPSEP